MTSISSPICWSSWIPVAMTTTEATGEELDRNQLKQYRSFTNWSCSWQLFVGIGFMNFQLLKKQWQR